MNNKKSREKAIIQKVIITFNKQEDLEALCCMELDLALTENHHPTEQDDRTEHDNKWYNSMNLAVNQLQLVPVIEKIKPLKKAKVKVNLISVNVIQEKK